MSHHFMCYFLRSRAVRSLRYSVKALVGIEPHAETPPPPALSIIATQDLELLTSVSVRTRVSDTEFVVESVSTQQPQALNQNP